MMTEFHRMTEELAQTYTDADVDPEIAAAEIQEALEESRQAIRLGLDTNVFLRAFCQTECPDESSRLGGRHNILSMRIL
jgi:hypothetical protein